MQSPRSFCPVPSRDGAGRLRRRARARLALTLLGVLSACAMRAATPPVVSVEFVVAPGLNLTADYEGAALERCRAAVGERLAALGRQNFSYLRWGIAGSDTGAAPSVATLTLRLEENRRRFGDVVTLRYTGAIEGKAGNLPSLPTHELYAETSLSKPSHDPTRLIQDVIAATTAQFNNTEFRGRLQQQFLASVPLTATFELDSALRCVVLPISAGALCASKDSVLLAQYLTRLPDATARKAFVRLNPREPDADQWERPAGLVVVSFECLPDRANDWTPAVVETYQRRDATSMRVFMADYKKNYAAEMARGVQVNPRE